MRVFLKNDSVNKNESSEEKKKSISIERKKFIYARIFSVDMDAARRWLSNTHVAIWTFGVDDYEVINFVLNKMVNEL